MTRKASYFRRLRFGICWKILLKRNTCIFGDIDEDHEGFWYVINFGLLGGCKMSFWRSSVFWVFKVSGFFYVNFPFFASVFMVGTLSSTFILESFFSSNKVSISYKTKILFRIIHRSFCPLIHHHGDLLLSALKICGWSIIYSKRMSVNGGNKTHLAWDQGTNLWGN